jgi:metal-responsive CopG/Arc/MetJ family transcriptional regulator
VPIKELQEVKMQQSKISFDESQIKILNKYKEYGFKDKSSLVRSAIVEFIKSAEKQKLVKSANLYAEIYKEDSELRDLTNSAIEDWPK